MSVLVRAAPWAVICLASLAPAQANGQREETGQDSVITSPSVEPDGGAPISAEQFHEDGVRLLRERHMSEAITALKQAVALDDASALYVTDLGYAYLLADRLGEAEVAFRQGIARDPKRPHAYDHLVESILRQPHRWEKRNELFQLLERGIRENTDTGTRVRVEIARIRAERGFGLLERARSHIEENLRNQRITRALQKQLIDLRARVAADEKARTLRDWPEPEVSERSREHLAECERLSASRSKKESLACVTPLLEEAPAWRAPRRLRAKLLTEQGHYDEAVKELTTLTRLQPSEPIYHRQLGILLAEHGGLLELERADEALRIAAALEPEWSDLKAIRAQLAARRFDSLPNEHKPQRSRSEPTDNAKRLFDEAEASLGEGSERARSAEALLEQALRESPAFVEAAALLYAISRRIPEKSVEAIWNDRDAMFALYQECAQVEPALPRPVLDRWLNRAIELGSIEGRLARALIQRDRGDRTGAERELANYLASISSREEIDSVQLLRSELLEKPKTALGRTREAILAAQLSLQSEDPDGALRLLEAPCRPDMEPERQLWAGIAFEQKSDIDGALRCYEFGLAGSSDQRAPMARRLARLLARADASWLRTPIAEKLDQLTTLEPAASWALARRAAQAGRFDAAKADTERYLAAALPNDRFVGEARELLGRLNADARRQSLRRHHELQLVSAFGGLAVVVAALWIHGLWFRGKTLARAIRRRPQIFPEVRRIIGQLRHDVLKHRTSALELLPRDPSALDKLRRTLLEPTPTSQVVTEAYSHLCEVARGERVTLRRIHREPVFGPLVKDLVVVEQSLRDGKRLDSIESIDRRLRTLHHERLQALLASGPRCDVNATLIQRWTAAQEAELVGQGCPWVVPALQMSDFHLSFPIDSAGLFQIFANLMRNAQAAAGGTPSPKVLVRVLRELDFAGRTWVKLQIGDNAEGILSDADVESRAADRGLGIVRDTVRAWYGRVAVRPEGEPYRKTVGVEFGL